MQLPSNSSPPSSQLKFPPDSGLDLPIHQMVTPWQVVLILPSLSGISKQVEWSTKLNVRFLEMAWGLCGHWMERQFVPFPHRGSKPP